MGLQEESGEPERRREETDGEDSAKREAAHGRDIALVQQPNDECAIGGIQQCITSGARTSERISDIRQCYYAGMEIYQNVSLSLCSLLSSYVNCLS
jgi:hypothetical protein